MFATMLAMLPKLLLLVAQTTQGQGGGGGGTGGQQTGSPYQFIFLIVIMIAIFYFVVFRDQRKKQRERKSMIENIRKGDKVLTIGGMIGTIVNIKDNEITIKVDEASNTKITFVRSAVDRVLSTREGNKQEAA